MSPKGQHISDQSGFGKYFTQVANIAIQELDPYQLALYMQYKRICSLKNGVTFMSNKRLAESAGMSVRKLQSVRSELQELGYIQIENQYDPDGNINKAPHVTVLDIMSRNIQYWDNEYSSSVPHAQDAHPHAQDAHPHAQDAPKEYIDKDTNIKEKRVSPSGDAPAETKTAKRDELKDWIAQHIFKVNPYKVPKAMGFLVGNWRNEVIAVHKLYETECTVESLQAFLEFWKQNKAYDMPTGKGKVTAHYTKWYEMQHQKQERARIADEIAKQEQLDQLAGIEVDMNTIADIDIHDEMKILLDDSKETRRKRAKQFREQEAS